MVAVVCPDDQLYWAKPAGALKLVLPPGQKVLLPVIWGDKPALWVTVALAVPEHPAASRTVTV